MSATGAFIRAKMRTQIPLLHKERHADYFFEKLFVAIQQSLMDGRFGINLFESGEAIRN